MPLLSVTRPPRPSSSSDTLCRTGASLHTGAPGGGAHNRQAAAAVGQLKSQTDARPTVRERGVSLQHKGLG